MGIWVRSQCNGLGEYVKFLPPVINREQLPDLEVPFATMPGKILHVSIMGMNIGTVDKLGEYNTEAEALRVLDMIQEYIAKGQQQSLDYGDGRTIISQVVFQMPEAGFSAKPEEFMPDCGADLKYCELMDGTNEDGARCDYYGKCKAAWDRGCR
jgi:hypothetical protein